MPIIIVEFINMSDFGLAILQFECFYVWLNLIVRVLFTHFSNANRFKARQLECLLHEAALCQSEECTS